MGTALPLVTVRLLEGAPGRDFVVEMISPIARNALHRTYSALRAIGVQVLHTTLRTNDGRSVQTLQLAELDDASLDARRGRQVLAVLNEVCA